MLAPLLSLVFPPLLSLLRPSTPLSLSLAAGVGVQGGECRPPSASMPVSPLGGLAVVGGRRRLPTDRLTRRSESVVGMSVGYAGELSLESVCFGEGALVEAYRRHELTDQGTPCCRAWRLRSASCCSGPSPTNSTPTLPPSFVDPRGGGGKLGEILCCGASQIVVLLFVGASPVGRVPSTFPFLGGAKLSDGQGTVACSCIDCFPLSALYASAACVYIYIYCHYRFVYSPL